MDTSILLRSINSLDRWLVKNDYKDYDPFDGLSMKWADLLTFNNHYLKIALQQTIRRSPVNLRPYVGIKKARSSKGMGFCAWGYIRLFEMTGSDDYRQKARFCLDWLSENYSRGYAGHSWGNHFSYESRGGKIPLDVPTIVWTSLIANVFLDAFQTFKETRYLDVARSSGEFILSDIKTYDPGDGSHCFMYTPLNGFKPELSRCIHNSNVLGAWLLSRLYSHTGDQRMFSLAKKAIRFTVQRQLPQGGWYYGEPNKFHWIDNFHTGYVLESICGYMRATGDHSFEDSLRKGYKYLLDNFFEPDGRPRYYHHKTFPIDIQCASQAIQTCTNLSDYDQKSLSLAYKVAHWTIKNMQDEKGFFNFRKYPLMTNKTPTFHWGQATMLSALGNLVKKLELCN